MQQKPTVVIINGSPRKESNTMVLANMVKGVIESLGGKVIVENLAEKNIEHCIGCWSADNNSCTYPCVIKDDLNSVFKNMLDSDGVIFVSGVYWFGVSGLLKLMIDRMTCLWNNGVNKPLLDNKAAAFISSSMEEGNVSAMAPLMATCSFLGMHMLPYGLIYGNAKEKSDLDKGWGPEFAKRCARNMITKINLLKDSKSKWW